MVGTGRCTEFRELVVQWLRSSRSVQNVRRFSQFREHAEFRAMAGTGRCLWLRDQAKHWAIGKNSLGARKSVVLWCKKVQ